MSCIASASSTARVALHGLLVQDDPVHQSGSAAMLQDGAGAEGAGQAELALRHVDGALEAARAAEVLQLLLVRLRHAQIWDTCGCFHLG